MRSYILQIICCGVLCACVLTLFRDNDSNSKIIRILCGIFMLISLLSPVVNIDNLHFAYTDSLTKDAQKHILDGQYQASQTLSAFIKEECEAYIVEKAAQMGVNIHAQVELNTDNHPVPYSVTINGAVSPYTKSKLQSILTEDLAIPKERQKWI